MTRGALVLVGLLGQGAALTALLYFFGWSRARAYLIYFGVDLRLLQPSVVDMVLGSTAIALPLIFYSAVLGAGAWLAAAALARAARDRRRLSIVIASASLVAGMACLVTGGAYVRGEELPVAIAWRPLPIGLTPLLVLYAYHVARGVIPRTPRVPVGLTATTLLVASTAVIWSWGLYAQLSGQKRAIEDGDTMRDRESVVVYSTKPLAISGHGVGVCTLPSDQSQYAFRYDGLRLLARAGNGDLFLLPSGWLRGEDAVFQVHVDESVRIDLRPFAPAS